MCAYSRSSRFFIVRAFQRTPQHSVEPRHVRLAYSNHLVCTMLCTNMERGAQTTVAAIVQGRRASGLSRGALAGGFTKESLQGWARDFWKEENVRFVDLHSQKVSSQCSDWLNVHPNPSSQLARAFYGSIQFLPERMLLTPFCYSNSTLPHKDEKIQLGHQFLLWKVVVDSPHEMILEWSVNGKGLGCTMVAFDPSLRKVYQGNCLKFEPNSISTKLHTWYAQLLLGGMVQQLEQEAKSSVERLA
jgi:hypothetical protein